MTRQSATDAGMAIFAIVVFLAILGGVTNKARSQEHEIHRGHAEFHDVYKEWMQPKPNDTLRCCDAKYDHHNNLIKGGDCYATVAEVRASAANQDGLAWWAKLDTGEWVEIPRRKIINELNPDETGTRAHICENFSLGGGVLCFLPAVGGS